MESRDAPENPNPIPASGDMTASEQSLATEQPKAQQPEQQTDQIAGLASTNEFSQPTCTNCGTSTTPLWRRDAIGAVLCNACGLFLKLHKRSRPISLKTDVIKSRNRIKTARQFPPNSKKKSQAQHPPGFNVTTDPNGLPISHQASQKSLHDHDGTGSPVPHYPHNLTHFTDIDGHFPVFSIPGASPDGTTPHHAGDHRGDVHESQDSLLPTNSRLKTRISELELINELFRGRLDQLEAEETSLRQQLGASREAENHLRIQLAESHEREMSLKRRLHEVSGTQDSPDGENSLKRRFDEVMGSQDSSLDLVHDDIQGPVNDHINGHGGDHVSEPVDEAAGAESSLAKRFKPDPGHGALPDEHDPVVDPSMQTAMDEAHVPNASMDHAPMDHAPVEQTPVEQTPTNDSAVESAPEAAVSSA
jgi:GATA-binding protein